MGVKGDIRWLKESEERVDLFVRIAKEGPLKVRDLKKFLGTDDWWPTKYHIQDLLEKELIKEKEGGYEVTDYGKKVFESLKTVYDIESI